MCKYTISVWSLATECDFPDICFAITARLFPHIQPTIVLALS